MRVCARGWVSICDVPAGGRCGLWLCPLLVLPLMLVLVLYACMCLATSPSAVRSYDCRSDLDAQTAVRRERAGGAMSVGPL